MKKKRIVTLSLIGNGVICAVIGMYLPVPRTLSGDITGAVILIGALFALAAAVAFFAFKILSRAPEYISFRYAALPFAGCLAAKALIVGIWAAYLLAAARGAEELGAYIGGFISYWIFRSAAVCLAILASSSVSYALLRRAQKNRGQ